MKIKSYILILLVSIPSFLSSQIMVSGKVISKNDGYPLPGANVVIQGTKTGTQTNFDGEFSIEVPGENTVFEISYIGFVTQEVRLKGQTYIEIQIKEDCNIDWFDSQHLGFYLNSGLIHNPVGGQVTFSSPHIFGSPVLKAGISYQTNTRENNFLNANVNLHHLFVSCGFEAAVNTSYRELSFENNIELNARAVETRLNWRPQELILGYSHIDFRKAGGLKELNGSGITIGAASWIGQPFVMSVSGKVTAYKDLTEYHMSLEKGYKGFNSFVRFYKVNSFVEVSFGVGFEITYLFKRQKRNMP